MNGQVIFLTHAEVEIDPEVPVPDWPLSSVGRVRHEWFARDPVFGDVRSIYASAEQKARDAAAISSAELGLPVSERVELGENDRSATGYLPPAEFWPVVDQFFADPDQSTRGWETARNAQLRITRATQSVVDDAPPGDVLIVAHGGVGTLLRCRLLGREITKSEGQPHAGGGCWFAFDRAMSGAPTQWRAI